MPLETLGYETAERGVLLPTEGHAYVACQCAARKGWPRSLQSISQVNHACYCSE
jgi:hypothetical protein